MFENVTLIYTKVTFCVISDELLYAPSDDVENHMLVRHRMLNNI